MKRLTAEEIIKKFTEVHGKQYEYSKVNYINKNTNVEITCKEHGSFFQKPLVHLRGNGCQTCSGKKPHTTNEVIETFKQIVK